MKRIGSFCKRHPFVIASGALTLLCIFNLAPDEEPRHAVLFGACLLWLWACAVVACWQPLCGPQIVVAMGLSAIVFLPTVGGVWVSFMAITVVWAMLLAEAVYIAMLVGLALRALYRWSHTADHLAPAAPKPTAPEQAEQVVTEPLANPRRVRKLWRVAIGVSLAAALLVVGSKIDDYYQYSRCVQLMKQPTIRYNMALRTVDTVLYNHKYQIQDVNKIYLYTQPAGLDHEQTKRVAEDIEQQLSVDCEVQEIPNDLHEMFLAAPEAVHLVLRQPQATKPERRSDQRGWLARGKAYYAYAGWKYNEDTKQYDPSYTYGIQHTDSIDPTTNIPPTYTKEEGSAPPTLAQQEQIDRLLADRQRAQESDIDPTTLPFALELPPDLGVMGTQYRDSIEVGTRCPMLSCKTGHNTMTLHWTKSRGGETLDSWRLATWGMGGQMLGGTVNSRKVRAGDYPARLLTVHSKYHPQYRLIIEGDNRFYQLDYTHEPPSEHEDDTTKQAYQAWTDWLQGFVNSFEER